MVLLLGRQAVALIRHCAGDVFLCLPDDVQLHSQPHLLKGRGDGILPLGYYRILMLLKRSIADKRERCT